jgi:hypothetical protein
MAKGVQKVKAKKHSRKNVMPGDTYQVATDVVVAKTDTGTNDLTFTHKVDKNGEDFVDATVIWYGLPVETSDAFVAALSDVGFVDDEVVETKKFSTIVKHWKNLTKALGKINKLGDDLTVALGETVEA